MPNWAETTVDVVLPKENKQKFLDLFLDFDHPKKNESKERYLARTFMTTKPTALDDGNGNTRIIIDCDCAWSIWSCWVDDKDGYPNGQKCLTMEAYCRELGVKNLSAESMELGMWFVEELYYTPESGLIYNTNDMTKERFIERFGEEVWNDMHADEDGSANGGGSEM